MSDQAALQARIAALAGQINKHKQHPSTHAPSHSHPHYSKQTTQSSGRWYPYARGGTRGGFPSAHRNRTLVLGGAQNTSSGPAADHHAREGYVDPPVVFENGSGEPEKRNLHQTQSQSKIQSQEVSTNRHEPATPSSNHVQHVLELEGVRFQVQEGGSKLMRLPGQTAETPKRCKVADVEFLRTKHGNLLRTKAQDGTKSYTTPKPKSRCESFTRYGTCPFGPRCRFAHIPMQVAICKEFLRHGSCQAGPSCNLSHDPTYQRVPACTHFLRGNCTNSACRYPHLNVSPAFRVCRPFATLGYCPKGTDCDHRHVFECPEYSNRGRCANLRNGSCPLPHIDHAATLRKIARRQAKNGADDESDLSSDDEQDHSEQQLEDVDSDVVEEDDTMCTDDRPEVPWQQSDFISMISEG